MKFVNILIILFAVSIAQCPNNCSNHGECVRNNSTNSIYCECKPEYARDNWFYRRIEREKALGLEAGLGFFGMAGGGRLYLGYIFTGILHLVVSLFFCCGGCFMVCKYRSHAETKEEATRKLRNYLICLTIVWVIYFIFMFIWYIAECAYIRSDDVVDAKGFKLY